MKKLPVLFFILIFISGCGEVWVNRQLFAMDTVMNIDVYGNNNSESIANAENEIKRLDSLLSLSDSESDIYALNRGKTVSKETEELIKRAVEIGEKTGGAFNITMEPVTELWGFYNKNFRVPSFEEIDSALKKTGLEKIISDESGISLKDGAAVDLGGIAKGYTSSRVAEILKEDGVKSAVISLGGNVQTIGAKPDGSLWRVAIQDPGDSKKYIGYVDVKDRAVITSGAYQRFFERNGVKYHHILDPKTGYPADSGLLSATIVSDDGTLADALSTAVFVMGYEKSVEYWRENGGFEMILVDADGVIRYTKGLYGNFFSDNEMYLIE